MVTSAPFPHALGDQPTLELIARQLADMETYMAAQVASAGAQRRATWAATPFDTWRTALCEWMGCQDVRFRSVSALPGPWRCQAPRLGSASS